MNKLIIKIIVFGLFVNCFGACALFPPLIHQPGIKHLGPIYSGLQNPIWSPDGKSIAATSVSMVNSWTSELYIIDVKTGKKKSILKTDFGNFLGEVWSPDSKQILISSQRGGDWQQGIWTIDADGLTPLKFLSDGYDAAWSPDGKQIALFSPSKEEGYQVKTLYIYDLQTGKKRVIFRIKGINALAGGLSWSPNHQNIFFSYGINDLIDDSTDVPYDLYSLNILTGESTKIIQGKDIIYTRLSPNGQFFASIHNSLGTWDPMLYIYNTDGSCTKKILEDAWDASWSPDGNKITFSSKGEIYILDIETFLGEKLTEEFLCR